MMSVMIIIGSVVSFGYRLMIMKIGYMIFVKIVNRIDSVWLRWNGFLIVVVLVV